MFSRRPNLLYELRFLFEMFEDLQFRNTNACRIMSDSPKCSFPFHCLPHCRFSCCSCSIQSCPWERPSMVTAPVFYQLELPQVRRQISKTPATASPAETTATWPWLKDPSPKQISEHKISGDHASATWPYPFGKLRLRNGEPCQIYIYIYTLNIRLFQISAS